MQNKDIVKKDEIEDEHIVDDVATKVQKKSPPYIAIILFILIVILAVLAAYFGEYFSQQLKLLQLQQQKTIHELALQEEQINAGQSKLKQRLELQSKHITNLQTEIKTLEDLSQNALAISNRGQRGWILAEVDYLLRLANRRLQIAMDIKGAIAALSSASNRLYDLGDLNLFPVRKQLSKEIAVLKSLHQVDVDGIAFSLDQALHSVNELPFKSVQQEVKNQIKQSNEQPKEKRIEQNFVDSVISTVMSMGDIKIHQRSIQPASSVQQQVQFEQLLRSHMTSARLAVLRFDQKQFLYDINKITNILSNHYKQEDNRVVQLSDDMQLLSKINLAPELPVVTASWNLLNELIIKSASQSQQEEH